MEATQSKENFLVSREKENTYFCFGDSFSIFLMQIKGFLFVYIISSSGLSQLLVTSVISKYKLP
uniref:Uncharacterized protein n=1 Tax=Rhizophora mucronata TaxID=61149 RepID=A0A2P2Q0A0_RHIMU